jgi:hypothetical protein
VPPSHLPDGSQPLLELLQGYPPLFHATPSSSLKPLLESKGLRACPVWNFADTAEYFHGVTLIRDFLRHTRKKEAKLQRLAEMMTGAYGDLRPSLSAVLSRVDENLTYELEHPTDPRVKVYVACFSTTPTPELMNKFGDCLIGFNFLLPAAAYYFPRPFTTSMLSRVTYDEDEFRLQVAKQGFKYDQPVDLERMRAILAAADPARRAELVSAWISEKLCLFAPNLKKPEFKDECEWRLKTVISEYPAEAYVSREVRRGQLAFMGLPSDATFQTVTGREAARYLHQFTCQGLFLSREITIPRGDRGLFEWVEEWQETKSMPPITPEEFSAGGAGIPRM